MRRLFCCGEVLETMFCPHCGTPYEDVIVRGNPYPHRFKTYVHGSSDEDENIDEMITKLGIDSEGKEAEEIYCCDYEVGLEFELNENKPITITGVEYNSLMYDLILRE